MPLAHAYSNDEATKLLADAPSPVVVVPVHNGFEDVVRCYESLFTHTPPALFILVVDDAGADRRPIELLDELAERLEHSVVVLHRAQNGGFVAGCNDAFEVTPGRDVILVNSDLVVGPEWTDRLTAAALSSTLIATASTLTNHGTILSLPHRNVPDDRLPEGMTPDEAARRVAEASLQLRPTIPTALGHCVYIKRIVLDAIGGFDPAFGTGYGEEVDFSQRALQLGFRHVCADDVFTFHRGGASFGSAATDQQRRNEELVNARYRWYRNAVQLCQTDRFSPLATAIDRGRIALVGMTIGVDGMCLGPVWAGTQTVTLETIRSLSHVIGADSQIVVFHGTAITRPVERLLDELPNVKRQVVHDIPRDHGTPVDVIYRPFQVSTLEELKWLRRVGRRVIVNQLDIIAWSNPSYFDDDHKWLTQRELTRLVLASVDGISFISDVARREVVAEGLVPASTPTRVVYCGTTSSFGAEPDGATRPPELVDDGRPILFALGASYHHKNRVFAVKLLQELRRRGWDGRLVLAGPTPPRGNSLAAEAHEFLLDPDIKPYVVQLGDLSEAEKTWIYFHTALSVYPTVSEGFGLIPFESANRDVPVLSSRQGSLAEVLPADITTLNGYDVLDAADLAWPLINDAQARVTQCAAIRAAGADFTWDRTAREVVALCEAVTTNHRSRIAAVWGEAPEPANLDVFIPDVRTLRERLEHRLARLMRPTRLKQVVVPSGSRRQAAVRSAANRARRAAGGF